MSEEIFSKKQRTANDDILAKVLFYNIPRQLRMPAALASVDAANCYDHVSHAIVSLVFRAFGSPEPMSASMLTAIQQMKFFLCTAFGDSDKAIEAKVNLKIQGLMQGNGAAPAGWTAVSIVILQAHKTQGHGASFVCPTRDLHKDISCILYVDDTDIIHLSEDGSDTALDALNSLQHSVTSWGNLLIVTDSTLKPSKMLLLPPKL
jgi:hypothetical protein